MFTIFRALVIIYVSIVNDMIFAYHILMCLLWIGLILSNGYAWLVVHSFYHELCEVTRLEDVARVKVREEELDVMLKCGYFSVIRSHLFFEKPKTIF